MSGEEGKELANPWEYCSEAALSRGGGYMEGADMELSWFSTSLFLAESCGKQKSP